jgi:NAD-dependent DNA ligase
MYDNQPIQLEGSSFCITGKFAFGGRKKCIACIESYAGTYSSTVTKTLDYLIVGQYVANDLSPNNSKKLINALKLQQNKGKIRIISEQQWISSIYSQQGLAVIEKWQPELF